MTLLWQTSLWKTSETCRISSGTQRWGLRWRKRILEAAVKLDQSTVIVGLTSRDYATSKTARICTPLPSTSVSKYFLSRFAFLTRIRLIRTTVVPHTPCLAWPNCYKGVLCPFKHPEPMVPKASIPAPNRGEMNLQQPQFGLPATFQPGAFSTSAGIPSNGPYQVYGTTYFPTISQGPSSPPQVPLAPQLARWAQPYGNWQPSYGVVPSEYPHFSSAYLQQQPLYETSLASPTMPAISQSPIHENLNFDRHAGYHDVPASMQSSELSSADQFPYIAPKEQRPGHARRISVALKSKEDTDAIELQARDMSRRRESWMTHGHHATHKVRKQQSVVIVTMMILIPIDPID